MKDELFKRLLTGGYTKSTDYIGAFSTSIGTSIGCVRKVNEDRVIFSKLSISKFRKNIYVLILCDGMGGMKSGDLAASLATSSILEYLLEYYDDENIHQSIIDAVNHSNKAVYSSLGGEGGCTLSLVLFSNLSDCHFVNIGDSRIYNGFKSTGLKQLTEDDDLKHLLAKEKLSINEDVLLNRNGLTKFIGMDIDLDLSIETIEAKGTVILLSDGVHRIGQKLMAVIYNYSKNAFDFVNRIITLSEWMGGVDNASCVIVDFESITPDIFEMSEPYTTAAIWDSQGVYQFSRTKFWNGREEDKKSKSSSFSRKKNKIVDDESLTKDETINFDLISEPRKK